MPPAHSPHAAAPRSLAAASLPRRVRRALEQALTHVSAALEPALGAMLNEYDEELFRLADAARSSTVQGDYLHAVRTLRLHRADLIPRFLLELEASLARIREPAAGSGRVADAGAPGGFGSLALVDVAAMDEGTVLAAVASRQEGRATLPLHLLGQRFGVLAGRPAMDADHLPIGPRALCRAIRHASEPIQVSMDARLLLYRVFERTALANYAQTLESLDAALAVAGVLPGLSFVPLRTRPAPQRGEAVPAADAAALRQRAQTCDDAAADTTQMAAGGSEGPISTAGVTVSGGTPGTSAGAGSAASAAPGSGSTSGTRRDAQRPHTAWMSEAVPLPDEDETAALSALQQLITGRRELLGKLRPTRETASGPRELLSTDDVFGALGQLQIAPLQAGAPSTLQDIKLAVLAQARQERGRGAALSPKDNDTFELLSMLYGQIETEIRPDAPGAALLRRLQLPLLRVALQDRAFFVRGRHPARQLLNVVAESAAKWLSEEDFDPAMLAPLQQAVSHVVDNYSGDDAVFAASNQQLERHLQAHTRKAEMLERRHVEAARGKEKLEVAKRRAAEVLAAHIGSQRLPKFVLALLNQAWADVLTLTLLRQGEDSEHWRRHLDATRQIVAACAHGGAPAGDALRDEIQAALAQVGYHADEAEVIAQRLTSSASDDDHDAASRTELTVRLKTRARLGEDTSTVARPKLLPRSADEQARYDQLRVLPFGTWLEFVTNQQGDVVRRRLSWFSPITDNALFVNQRGQRIGEQSLDSLARMLASGQARIVTVERGRLVDRAWQAAVHALRSFAGRNDEATATEAT